METNQRRMGKKIQHEPKTNVRIGLATSKKMPAARIFKSSPVITDSMSIPPRKSVILEKDL